MGVTKILVGVDDSACSEVAIRYVTGASWPKTTKFLVLSAAAPVFVAPGEVGATDAIAELMRQQEKYHGEIAEKAAATLRQAGFAAEARGVVADPRTALIEVAQGEHADLIVVGSHGRTGIRKLLLGSVASHVVVHAPCSVLVVRETAAR